MWLGLPWADPVIGLVISLANFVLLITTAKDVGQRLLDGVDPHLTQSADQAIRALPEVSDVVELRLRWNGHRLNVQTSIFITGTPSSERFQEIRGTVDAATRKVLPGVGEVIVIPALIHTS